MEEWGRMEEEEEEEGRGREGRRGRGGGRGEGGGGGRPAVTRRTPAPCSSWPVVSSSCAVVWTPGSFPPARRLGRSSAAASAGTQGERVTT